MKYFLLILIVFSSSAIAEVNFSGYAKSYAIAQASIDNSLFSTPSIYQSQNSARLMLEGFSSNMVWQIHYEPSAVFTSKSLNVDIPTFNVVSESYRLTDIEHSLTSDEDNKTQAYQNLDRFNVQFQFDSGDLTIGRQAISFGSARIISPTDIFLPFDVLTFNTEYRVGVDAIRFQRPVGELGEIDIGIVFGKDADRDNSAAFLQLRGNYDGKDLQFAYIEYAEQTLAGIGIQSAIGDFGFWFEAAHVDGETNYMRMSIGMDYAFTENTFAQIEYHYNGAGSDHPETYLQQFDSLPYQLGGIFLLGRDYLMPSFSIQLSPLWNLGTHALYNLSDDSVFISVAAEFNVAENFYMDFGIYHFSGDDLRLSAFAIPELGSEFGQNPDTACMSIRYYF